MSQHYISIDGDTLPVLSEMALNDSSTVPDLLKRLIYQEAERRRIETAARCKSGYTGYIRTSENHPNRQQPSKVVNVDELNTSYIQRHAGFMRRYGDFIG